MTKKNDPKSLSIVEQLKQEPDDIIYVGEIGGGRHVLDVPIDMIEQHEDFTAVRGKDPKDLSILRDSMKNTDGAIYPPCVFISRDEDGRLHIFVADGHQRLHSAKANGDERIAVQFIARWTTTEEALTDVISVNYARFEMGQADIVSLIRSGKKTQAEIARLTGLGESKISRLAKVADSRFDWLYKAVELEVLGLGKAGKLVDSCNDNSEKILAVKNTLDQKLTKAKENADFWANRMKSQKRKWDRKTRETAKVSTYFKDVDWDAWANALEDDAAIKSVDGEFFLRVDESAAGRTTGVRIGDVSDWKKEFAVYGIFEKKIESVDPKDIDEVLDQWDYLRNVLESIRDGKDVPSMNPIKDVDPPQPPAVQEASMKVGRPKPTDA